MHACKCAHVWKSARHRVHWVWMDTVQVAVADMLRFHRFTIGHAWCSEYGNAEENETDFHNVMKYSPLHNITAPTSEVCVCVFFCVCMYVSFMLCTSAF